MLKTVSPFNTKSPTFSEDVTLSTGNVVIGTAGKGIDFSATPGSGGTTTGELFSDYEEGTFTPALDKSSTSATITYSTQTGYYRKVGSLLFISVTLVWTANSGGTGNWIVTGLPYLVPAGVFDPVLPWSYSGATFSTGYTELACGTRANNPHLYVYENGSGKTGQWFGSGAGTFGASGELRLSGCFRV